MHVISRGKGDVGKTPQHYTERAEEEMTVEPRLVIFLDGLVGKAYR
jgi:hypothetical protein